LVVSRLLVQPRIDRLPEYADLVAREDVWLELIEFSHADLDRAGLAALADRYLDALGADLLGRVVTFHGAFMDLTISSPDIYVANASRTRVLEGVELAARFSPQYLIFHSNLLPPLATYDGYEDAWVATNIEFWRSVVAQTKATVLLENMFDPNPSAICRVLAGVDSERMKACLNVGHANAFSRVPLHTWFTELDASLVYCHFSDNDGTNDASLPPGQGTVDWADVSELARSLPNPPDVLMGIAHRGIPAIEEGIEFLRSHGFHPFGPASTAGSGS
jgi:sugar phosphate isomerase/epimerase